MDLTKELRNIRRAMSKTQKELAELLGIPQTTWASYEVGKAKPPIKILMQLSELGYPLPGLSNSVIVGNNNTQTIGHNNSVHIPPTPDGECFSIPLFEVPLLTKEDVLKYNPKQEILDPQAHNGRYPDKVLIPSPYWLKEFSTDLRAITIFDSRMAPRLNAGDVAIFEGTGYTGDGIYVHRFENTVHISYIHWRNNRFVMWTEFKPDEKVELDTIDPIGRIRATVKRV